MLPQDQLMACSSYTACQAAGGSTSPQSHSLWQDSAHQTFAIPTLQLAGIKATAKDGVLSISVPKAPQPQPVHIPVQAGGEHADGKPAEQAEQEPAVSAEEPAQQE